MDKKLMFRSLLLICAILLFPSAAYAEDTYNVTASVRDASTNRKITDAMFRMLELPDSTVFAEGEASTTYYTGSSDSFKKTTINNFRVNGLLKSKRYVLELTCSGYEPLYTDIDPSKLNRKSYDLPLGSLSLIKARTLSEFTVSATKVKFYNKGDTIVYNADAFVLAEGSMLDALISQLPGAEIKEGGQIYVNGRYVESLLLNGKDFFQRQQSGDARQPWSLHGEECGGLRRPAGGRPHNGQGLRQENLHDECQTEEGIYSGLDSQCRSRIWNQRQISRQALRFVL